MGECVIEGCGQRTNAKRLCHRHYWRLRKFGSPLVISQREPGTGGISEYGYLRIRMNGVSKFEHVLVAEAALGKPLPAGSVVHHINENRLDNRPQNLLVCSRAYHLMIHARMRALAACGNANWLKCRYCKQYDDPSNMVLDRNGGHGSHKRCQSDYQKAYGQRPEIIARRKEYTSTPEFRAKHAAKERERKAKLRAAGIHVSHA